jgi:hypothetical protein
MVGIGFIAFYAIVITGSGNEAPGPVAELITTRRQPQSDNEELIQPLPAAQTENAADAAFEKFMSGVRQEESASRSATATALLQEPSEHAAAKESLNSLISKGMAEIESWGVDEPEELAATATNGLGQKRKASQLVQSVPKTKAKPKDRKQKVQATASSESRASKVAETVMTQKKARSTTQAVAAQSVKQATQQVNEAVNAIRTAAAKQSAAKKAAGKKATPTASASAPRTAAPQPLLEQHRVLDTPSVLEAARAAREEKAREQLAREASATGECPRALVMAKAACELGYWQVVDACTSETEAASDRVNVAACKSARDEATLKCVNALSPCKGAQAATAAKKLAQKILGPQKLLPAGMMPPHPRENMPPSLVKAVAAKHKQTAAEKAAAHKAAFLNKVAKKVGKDLAPKEFDAKQMQAIAPLLKPEHKLAMVLEQIPAQTRSVVIPSYQRRSVRVESYSDQGVIRRAQMAGHVVPPKMAIPRREATATQPWEQAPAAGLQGGRTDLLQPESSDLKFARETLQGAPELTQLVELLD